MTAYDRAFEMIIGHEGGYVNDPNDPGGETKYGISKRSYPREDIRSMTLDRAKAIYRRDYWDHVRGDELPEVVARNVFDGAVNSGVFASARWLQRALGVTDDGQIGPITLAAANAGSPDALAARYNGQRLDALTYMGNWSHFGRGWARRVAKNMKEII